MNTLISVIVPVYNSEKYIQKCLLSICNSTYKELDILCINDGSTDSSLSLMQRIAAEDSRIRIFNQKNSGLCAARNKGLQEAKGEFITFIDSDDWIHKDYFTVLATVIKEQNCDIAMAEHESTNDSNYQFDDLSNTVKAVPVSIEKSLHIKNIKYYVWGKLYKKTVIEHLLFNQDVKFSEDVLFLAEIYLNNPDLCVYKVPDKLYAYYDNSESLVHIAPAMNRLKPVSVLLSILSDSKADKTLKNLYYKEIAKQCLAIRYRYSFDPDYKKIKKICNSYIRRACSFLKKSDKDYIIYAFFYLNPAIYRQWRIKMDPTLKKWEKSMKKRE